MADVFDKEKRSWVMSRITGKDTKPERLLRSLLHRRGFLFTVNGPFNKKLPGRPDIVLPKHKTIIFVHGCYWHRHEGCKLASEPKSNTAFWKSKFNQNVERDKRNVSELKSLGWSVGIIWECSVRNGTFMEAKLKELIINRDCWEV